MKTQKITGIALALFVGAGAFAGGVTALPAGAEEAAESAVTISEENAALFLPDGYEKYLNLENPTYVAMTETHIAIADEACIYIYDRVAEEYGVYEHTVGDTEEKSAVSKIQFSENGSLYFRDDRSNLYAYDFKTGEATILDNMPCLTFLIQGDYMYMANASPTAGQVNFSYAPLNDLRQGAVKYLVQGLAASNPRMAFEDGTLYCIINNNTVNAYDAETHTYISSFTAKLDGSREQITDLQFVCAFEGNFYYTVNGTNNRDNGLYRTDFSGNSVRLIEGDAFKSITSYNNKLYCVQGQSIRELTVAGQNVGFTDYEIAAASASYNRLSGATESARANSLLVTCDAGNRRISVYDAQTQTYQTIACEDNGAPFTPEHIAVDKDGARIAVSSDSKIYLYRKEADGFTLSHVNGTTTKVTGVAFVYDECYFITANNGYGYFTPDRPQAEIFYFSGTSVPSALTRDVYGTLYVNFGGEVYSFDEDEFRAAGAEGEKQLTLPAGAHSLQSDYEGNLWYLIGDALYRNDKAEAVVGEGFVYRGKDAPSSFALGFEDGAVYFGFGDYMIKMNAGALKSLSTLNEIPVENAKDLAFSLHEEGLFLTVHSRAIGIEVGLDDLKEGESGYFAYRRYYRTKEAQRAIVLAETERHYLVALYTYDDDLKTNVYTANLFRKEQTERLDDDWQESALNTAYLTNEVAASYAPCLFEVMTVERLARGTKVNVLNTVAGEDGSYALVEYGEAERAAKRAYVPLSYLTKVNPLGSEQMHFTLGSIKNSKEGVTLTGANGESIVVKEHTEAYVYDNGDGTFTVRVTQDGKVYTGVVDGSYIARGETDALRISLIVILSVLAVVIVGAYVYLMFGKKSGERR